MFPDIFVANKTSYFSQEVGLSPSVIVANKTCILSQTLIFFLALTGCFVIKSNQGPSTGL